MSAYERYFLRSDPKPLEQLTRAQVAARIRALRSALDTLAGQSDLDGGAVYPCTGAMKGCLIDMENRLRDLDQQARERPFAAAVAEPMAEQRLQRAQTDLEQLRRGA